jgi:plasmid stability protein
MLDMSDLQLKEYTAMRKEEIDKELREKKKKKAPAGAAPAAAMAGPTLYEMVTKGQNSTFKIFSRAACNFAFPSDMDRPRPADFRDIQMALGVAEEEKVGVKGGPKDAAAEEGAADAAAEVAAVDAMNADLASPSRSTLTYEEAIRGAVSELRARGAEVFSREMLPRYSPKFQAILDRMDAARGPVLVYSQFKTLEGVGLFAMSMEFQKGFRKFDILPAGAGGWTLAEETRTAPRGTPFYITYTGDEDAEKRNILKAVFNAAWGKMPSGLAAEIKELTGADNNQKGAIARVFMITQSGAEGISLSNVRQVHIMEPYWNYVRLEQVKGRAIRICSHMDLPIEERTVDVYTYVCRFSAAQVSTRLVDETLQNFDGGATTDQSILTLSNAKKKLADALFDVMQSSAVDCELNAGENGALACYRFAGEPTMEPLFHPLVAAHLKDAEAAVRAR